MSNFLNGLNDVESLVESVYEILSGSLGIVALIGAIISVLVSVILSIAQWILLAIPLYKLAVKTGRKYPWIAWIPIVGDYCRTFVLCDIPGEKEVVLFKDFKIKSRMLAFWIWVGIFLFGKYVWNSVMTLLGGLLAFTGIGVALAALKFVPNILIGFLEYVFLRDVLDTFKSDKKSNNIWAIVVTVIDLLLPWRFARTICLYTLLKREPLTENTEPQISAED